MYSKALIVANGFLAHPGLFDDYFEDLDLIIAADGGLRHLKTLGLKPHILVGDMDSAEEYGLDEPYRKSLEVEGVEVIRLNVKKDESDTEIALALALERGARFITMLAATGSRLDHSLFNINLAFDLVSRGLEVRLYDGRQEVLPLIGSSELELKKREGLTLSVVPFTDLRGLSLVGFDYPLEEVDIPYTRTLTSSNVVSSSSSLIKLKEGRALIVISKGY